MSKEKETYTQREWDRVVGWGKVPPEYAEEIESTPDTPFIGYSHGNVKEFEAAVQKILKQYRIDNNYEAEDTNWALHRAYQYQKAKEGL